MTLKLLRDFSIDADRFTAYNCTFIFIDSAKKPHFRARFTAYKAINHLFSQITKTIWRWLPIWQVFREKHVRGRWFFLEKLLNARCWFLRAFGVPFQHYSAKWYIAKNSLASEKNEILLWWRGILALKRGVSHMDTCKWPARWCGTIAPKKVGRSPFFVYTKKGTPQAHSRPNSTLHLGDRVSW